MGIIYIGDYYRLFGGRLGRLIMRCAQVVEDAIGLHTQSDSVFASSRSEVQSYQHDIKGNFEQLVYDYSDTIYRFLMYRFNLRKQACDDIFQECVCRIYEKSHLYDPTRPLDPRILTIAYRTAIDCLSKDKIGRDAYRDMQEIEQFLDRMQDYEDDPGVEAEKVYKEALIHYVLDKLTEKHRTLIVLSYFEDRSYAEIAEIIECKPSSVGTLLARAREELQVHIESNEYLRQALMF